jgi:hypothetical protein
MMPEITIQIASNSDDACGYGGDAYWSINSPNVAAGYLWEPFIKFFTGIRFPVPVPYGSTILGATLRGFTDYTRGGGAKSYIHGEKVADAQPWSTLDDYNTRFANKTTEYREWNFPDGVIWGAWYESLDISPIVQEIIDQPTWEENNNMAFFWEDLANRSTSVVSFYAHDTQPDYAMQLYVSYTGPAPAKAFKPKIILL